MTTIHRTARPDQLLVRVPRTSALTKWDARTAAKVAVRESGRDRGWWASDCSIRWDDTCWTVPVTQIAG